MIRRLLTAVATVGAIAIAAPAVAAAAPFSQCPAVGAAPSCDVLITVAGSGQVSLAVDSSIGPYDGSDDQLIGVDNESPRPVQSLTLDGGGNSIFGFDGDGLCTYITCSWPAPTGYEGPLNSFTGVSADQTQGTVTFTGSGLPAGQSTYFSLEGAPTSATAITGTSDTTVNPAPINDPGFNQTPLGGGGLTVTVAQPPPLISPTGKVIKAGGGIAGAFDPSDPSTYGPCDPGPDTHFWHTVGVTITCLGSLKGFTDPTLGAKNTCIVNVGIDIGSLIAPAGKLLKGGKVTKDIAKLKDPLQALADYIKSLKNLPDKQSAADSVLGASKTLLGIETDLGKGDFATAGRDLVTALFGSDTLITQLATKLKKYPDAAAKLTAIRNGLKTVADDLDGVTDVKNCIRAF